MQSIYIKYFNKFNEADKKRDKICICILRLEQEFYIIIKKKEQVVFFLSQQIVKVKRYKKMINAL